MGGEFCLPPLAAASGGPCPGRTSAVRLTTWAAMAYSHRNVNRAFFRGRWPLGKLIGLAYFCKTTIKNAMSAGVIPDIRAA